MSITVEKDAERHLAGLCEDCLHARRILSERGALFFLCGLSFDDRRFAKYPRLPILRCSGYSISTESAGVGEDPVG
jgi:hypothetical protein